MGHWRSSHWRASRTANALASAHESTSANDPAGTIELNVRSSNAAAQALYRKLGFTEMGRWRRRVKIAEGLYLDDVAMELFVT